MGILVESAKAGNVIDRSFKHNGAIITNGVSSLSLTLFVRVHNRPQPEAVRLIALRLW